MTTTTETPRRKVQQQLIDPPATGSTVYWRMRYRTGPETWAYETIEARVLTSGKEHCLVEITTRGMFPRPDYRLRIHLMPTARLSANRADAEARTWHDNFDICSDCGTHKAGTSDCFETVVDTR